MIIVNIIGTRGGISRRLLRWIWFIVAASSSNEVTSLTLNQSIQLQLILYDLTVSVREREEREREEERERGRGQKGKQGKLTLISSPTFTLEQGPIHNGQLAVTKQ